MKRTTTFTLLLITTFLLVTPVSAATKKAKALEAYRDILSQTSVTIDDKTYSEYELKERCSFATAYIDNDSIPELIIKSTYNGQNHGFYHVFSYIDGKVVHVCQLGIEFKYYKKRGLIRTDWQLSYTQGGPGSVEQYIYMKKGKAKTSDSYSIYKAGTYGRTKDNKSYTKGTFTGAGVRSNKTISAKKYKSAIRKIMNNKKATKPKFFKNTEANRNKKL